MTDFRHPRWVRDPNSSPWFPKWLPVYDDEADDLIQQNLRYNAETRADEDAARDKEE